MEITEIDVSTAAADDSTGRTVFQVKKSTINKC